MEHRVGLQHAVIADIFAIGPLRLRPAGGIEIPLQHHLGVGRDLEVAGHAFDDGHGRAAHPAEQRELVLRRHQAQAGDRIGRVRADHDGDRQALAAGVGGAVDRAQIARRVEVDPRNPAAAQHEPAHADIGQPGPRVAREIEPGRDIGRAVERVLEMDRERGEIRLAPLQHHLLHRRPVARNLDWRDRRGDALQDRRHQPALLGPERQGQPRPAPHQIADQRRALRPGAPEQHRLRVAVEPRRHPGQRDRLVDHIDLICVDQPVDQPREAEPVEVDGRNRVGHRTHPPNA